MKPDLRPRVVVLSSCGWVPGLPDAPVRGCSVFHGAHRRAMIFVNEMPLGTMQGYAKYEINV